MAGGLASRLRKGCSTLAGCEEQGGPSSGDPSGPGQGLWTLQAPRVCCGEEKGNPPPPLLPGRTQGKLWAGREAVEREAEVNGDK